MFTPTLQLAIGLTSFATGAGLYALLLVLLISSWQGRVQGALLLAAAFTTLAWSAAAALHLGRGAPGFFVIQLLEMARNGAWLLFLWHLLYGGRGWRWSALDGPARRGLTLILLFLIALPGSYFGLRMGLAGGATLLIAKTAVPLMHVALAVLGMLFSERLYRGTEAQQRWQIKYLCFGVGTLFAYDFVVYTDLLLFQRINGDLWNARGFICAMTAPLVAVSAARNPQWSVNVFISKRVVYHSAVLGVAAAYLLVLAIAGYYLKIFGGEWGGVLRTVLVVAAVLGFLLVAFSDVVRARVWLFLTTHFYQNKYEYGEEWLKFSERLTSSAGVAETPGRVRQAIAELLGASASALWMRRGEDRTLRRVSWDAELDELPEVLALPAGLVEWWQSSEAVIELAGVEGPGQEWLTALPGEITGLHRRWLLVPILHQGQLLSVLLLTEPPVPGDFTAEDRDLVRAVARQAAGYLALSEATEQLAESRQFEAFNRLSAFLVHDLKNVVAQLNLVGENAERHRDNPAFIDDALATVANASERMTRMLGQLRRGSGSLPQRDIRRVDLAVLLRRVQESRSHDQPVPRLDIDDEPLWVLVDSERLEAVFGHFVQNGQEATPATGSVVVRLSRAGQWARVTVEDTGVGMSPAFVRDQLFRAFRTTKGNAGMGIGMYEGKRLIDALGGSVSVDSEPGAGTRFTIELPLDSGAQDG